VTRLTIVLALCGCEPATNDFNSTPPCGSAARPGTAGACEFMTRPDLSRAELAAIRCGVVFADAMWSVPAQQVRRELVRRFADRAEIVSVAIEAPAFDPEDGLPELLALQPLAGRGEQTWIVGRQLRLACSGSECLDRAEVLLHVCSR
jgi:hypothetical protein